MDKYYCSFFTIWNGSNLQLETYIHNTLVNRYVHLNSTKPMYFKYIVSVPFETSKVRKTWGHIEYIYSELLSLRSNLVCHIKKWIIVDVLQYCITWSGLDPRRASSALLNKVLRAFRNPRWAASLAPWNSTVDAFFENCHSLDQFFALTFYSSLTYYSHPLTARGSPSGRKNAVQTQVWRCRNTLKTRPFFAISCFCSWSRDPQCKPISF